MNQNCPLPDGSVEPVNGILLLYHHPVRANAPTILEHVHALVKHSRFKVWAVNTEYGCPERLPSVRFRIVVLHYSLFGSANYLLDDRFRAYLRADKGSCKIAFFQDEYHCCQQRFSFINRLGIDAIYTLLQPQHFDAVYGKYTQARRLVHCLPSYVSPELPRLAVRHARPDLERDIDIGYRGRGSYYQMGKGAREKTEIAERFLEACAGLGLRLDIGTAEHQRIYGNHWYRFLGNCKGALGVETGVSIFDVEDEARSACEDYLRRRPTADFDEVWQHCLRPFEGNIPYRTIGPRHFEAAALRTCQILYEGEYSGVLKPMVHYLPLKKDFSNFRKIINLFRDPEVRRELTENAYRDVIASGCWSYQRFVQEFDEDLLAHGFALDIEPRSLRRGAAARTPLWQMALRCLRLLAQRGPGKCRGLLQRARSTLDRAGGSVQAAAFSPVLLAGYCAGKCFQSISKGFAQGRGALAPLVISPPAGEAHAQSADHRLPRQRRRAADASSETAGLAGAGKRSAARLSRRLPHGGHQSSS